MIRLPRPGRSSIFALKLANREERAHTYTRAILRVARLACSSVPSLPMPPVHRRETINNRTDRLKPRLRHPQSRYYAINPIKCNAARGKYLGGGWVGWNRKATHRDTSHRDGLFIHDGYLHLRYPLACAPRVRRDLAALDQVLTIDVPLHLYVIRDIHI